MRSNPWSLLATVVVIAALATLSRRALDARAAGQTANEEPAACVEPECAPGPIVDAMLGSPVVTMEEREACRDSAYLCRGLESKDGMARALRWSSETSLIRVRVPPPQGDRARGRAVQQAAINGILAWNGHPFAIQIEERDGAAVVDFTVQWMTAPPGAQLGQAGTRWTQENGRASLEVTSFRLALVSPGTGRELLPDEIALTAAHEMGHALGLPHSDEPRDVMYPTNTASTLSTRDYKAMQALYRLPNGVGIWRPGEKGDE